MPSLSPAPVLYTSPALFYTAAITVGRQQQQQHLSGPGLQRRHRSHSPGAVRYEKCQFSGPYPRSLVPYPNVFAP